MADPTAHLDAPMLELREVTVSFGDRRVLDRVSIEVGDAEVVALLGPSGSGKSTVLRVIAGLIHHDAGHVVLDGSVIDDLPTHRRNIGLVFQDDQLFPHRSVAQNVEFGLKMQGIGRAARSERVTELLRLVGLSGFEQRRVTDLSGGEAKRVALARSLAPGPRLVLLDEPLTGLDRALHDQLRDELGTLLRSSGTAAVLVTHDPDEASAIAHRILRLDDLGRARTVER